MIRLRSRMIVYDLAVNVAGWAATTFLVGEYMSSEIDLPEFAILTALFDSVGRSKNSRRSGAGNPQVAGHSVRNRAALFRFERRWFDLLSKGESTRVERASFGLHFGASYNRR